MPKRILSALLALILTLGLAPCYGVPVAQAAEERTSIRLDFKETARSLARQDFWSALLSSQHEDIKYAGSTTYKQAMSDEAAQAYADLQSWLEENANWQIDESLSGLSNIWYWKTLYFNAARDIPWGLCFRPYFHGADRSDLILTVTVPEGGAGAYRLEMDIFRENTNSKNYLISSNPGGGKLDVYVNDRLVYERYDFAGGSRALENLGMVQLQDGENTIRLHSAAGFTGSTETSERCA